MSNILRLCELLGVTPNELLCIEEKVTAPQTEPQEKIIPEENSQKTGKQHLLIAILVSVCLVIGGIGGFALGWNMAPREEPDPIDFSVSGCNLVFYSYAGAENQMLKLFFTPNITNPEYDYNIIITDKDGEVMQVSAASDDGAVYTGTFYLEKGNSYLISVNMEIGEYIYSDKLIRVNEVTDSSVQWEQIQD